jgi:anti-sigma regulatory factor (Ser/Thr protein kinase)
MVKEKGSFHTGVLPIMVVIRRLLHSHSPLFSRVSKLQHHLTPPNLSFEQEYSIRSSLERFITEYSTKEVPQITLNSLIELAKSDPQRQGIAAINYLTVYNARRLSAFRHLPYLGVLNPHIAETYNLYLKSLELLLQLHRVEDSKMIHDSFVEYTEIHADAIPSLSKGFQEIRKFYPKESIVEFLNTHFRDKINMETIATNYITQYEKQKDHIGIVHSKLKPSDLVTILAGYVNDMTFIKYYKQVPVEIDFGADIEFPYIRHHLEYVITEVLKNSIRAHIENDKTETPVVVTIVQDTSPTGHRTLSLRFRDQGGGISPDIESNIFDYSFTSVEKQEKQSGMGDNVMPGEDLDTVAGMGYGLPLTKAYVEQFGGSLELQSCYGLGTDVYIRLIGPDTDLL